MEIEISKDIEINIEKVSKELGLSENEIIARALVLYFKNFREYSRLKEDMDEWENVGVEDSQDFFEKNNL